MPISTSTIRALSIWLLYVPSLCKMTPSTSNSSASDCSVKSGSDRAVKAAERVSKMDSSTATTDTAVTDKERLDAAISPAALAVATSQGQWKMVKHLAYLDRALTDTIRTGGRLIVTMPPQHGKSELSSKYLSSWFVGTYPDRRVMVGGYGSKFASHWGREARNLIERYGQEYFGVSVDRRTSAVDDWSIEGRKGGMNTAGTGGGFSGKTADLLLIDDPIKGFEQANSEVYREKVWQWFLWEGYTRLSPNAAVILIQTRWHADDLAGRILTRAEDVGLDWRVVNLPAFAVENDPLGRAVGEALWPEYRTHVWLTAQKKMLGSYPWSALYQQRPTPPEGGLFKREWFKIVDRLPANISKAVRYWDFGYSQGRGDYTASVIVCESEGLFYLVGVVRGQWSPLKRQQVMSQVAALDRITFGEQVNLKTWIPQDPAAGKEVAELEIKRMAAEGFYIKAESQHGKKEVNALPFAAACEDGAVRLVAGRWNGQFIDELCSFPTGANDDLVDAASRGFNKVAKPKRMFEMAVY